MGGIQDTYMRYERASDQYVGRVLSGLPINHKEFATLPPFFVERNNSVENLILECFLNIPNNMKRVGEFLLGSVVYHKQFLQNTLPKTHPLFHSSLFRNHSRLNSLFSNVDCPTFNTK